MLKHYLVTALRHIYRDRINTLINIIGLAIALTCCFVILMYIRHECSFDQFHEKGDRIVRLGEQWHRTDGGSWSRAYAGTAPGPRLLDEFPDIENIVRFMPQRALVGIGDTHLYENRAAYVDGSIFDVFSFRLVRGNPKTALQRPNSVVLTSSAAEKYFGDRGPLGEVMILNNYVEATVTGIMEDMPSNSHIRFAMLISLSTLTTRDPDLQDHWDCMALTYLLLRDGTAASELEARLPAFVGKYRDEEVAGNLSYRLQPLDRVHLHPLSVDIGDTVEVSRLYLFALIGFFILVVAGINFINLTTAQNAGRAVNASVRKILGASGGQLLRQYIGEAMVVAILSMILSIALSELMLPVFNSLAATDLQIDFFGDPVAVLVPVGLVLLVGLVGGCVPAFLLSRYQPATMLKSSGRPGPSGAIVRRVLVVFQLAVSVALILCTVVVYSQYRYLRSKDLGFQSAQLAIIPTRNLPRGSLGPLRNELEGMSDVLTVSASSTLPCDSDVRGLTVRTEDGVDRDICVVYADSNFASALGLVFVEGSDSAAACAAMSRVDFIVNRSAFETPEGQFCPGRHLYAYAGTADDVAFSYEGAVGGVVEDYHYRNLWYPRRMPLMIINDPRRIEYMLVRIAAGDRYSALASLREALRRYAPDNPVEVAFLEDYIDGFYRSERRFSTVFGYSCLLAVLVAVTGLFGLALHSAQQRTREIGIRKALGASVARIVMLIGSEFGWLVLLANVIGCPAAYYFLSGWLDHYPYRIGLGVRYFAAVVVASLMLTLVAVGYQSVRAALANPVDSLRHE